MEPTEFLPKVIVTTIVWAETEIFQSSKWESAQGDDLSNDRSTIELNLPRVLDRVKLDGLARALCEQWLAIYIVLATRQELINKHFRGLLSPKAEYLLCDANLKAIMDSSQLAKPYLGMAAKEIIEGSHYVGTAYQAQFSKAMEELREISGCSHRNT